MLFPARSIDPAAESERVAQAISARLKENIHSILLFGSAVRGNFKSKSSDLNLLIVLNESNVSAHAAISEILDPRSRVNPMLLAKNSLHRTLELFPLKFESIHRNYKVLVGSDPFSNEQIQRSDRTTIERALRNLEMRTVRLFLMSSTRNKLLAKYLIDQLPAFMTLFADVLRLENESVPTSFPERVPLFERVFGLDLSGTRKVLAVESANDLSTAEAVAGYRELVEATQIAIQRVTS